jgi:hypothetical protein
MGDMPMQELKWGTNNRASDYGNAEPEQAEGSRRAAENGEKS